MLKTISPLISSELLEVLAKMGYRDEIIFSDVHFLAHLTRPQVIRADGLLVSDLFQAIILLFELDGYAPPPVMMVAVEGDTPDPKVKRHYRNALSLQAPCPDIVHINRFTFHEQTQKAFIVVITGERAKYGNIFLRKGVTPQSHAGTPAWRGRLSNDGVKNIKAAHQQVIVDLLLNHAGLTMEALSEQLRVSKKTICRNLNESQMRGKILRNHGRAEYIHRQNQDSGDPFHIRLRSHYAHKADTMRKVFAWTEEGMVIALDASSACWYLARQLPGINIQVSANNHPTYHELGKCERTKLINSGGTLERKYGCYVNPPLISQLGSLEIDLFIFSCEGIDSSGALQDSNVINADYKSMLLKRAAQSLLLIDKSKPNCSEEAHIGYLDEVAHIISDERQTTTPLVTA